MRKNTEFRHLTSLPNANDKHIDYVIAYRVLDENESERNATIVEMREAFFDELKRQQSFEIHNVEYTNEKRTYVYALLHCPHERLLKEAQTMRLELRLKRIYSKNVFDDEEDDASLNNTLKQLFKRPVKTDVSGNVISAQFDAAISFLFQGIDDPDYPNGPFNNTLRILLVDNILNNLRFLTRKEILELERQQQQNTGMTSPSGEASSSSSPSSAPPSTSVVAAAVADANEATQPRNDETYYRTLYETNFKLKADKSLPFMLKENYFSDAFVCCTLRNNKPIELPIEFKKTKKY